MNKRYSLPVIDMYKTGQNIEKLRRENNLKIVDVQNIFGFNTAQAIYKWEHGRSFPSLENLVALAQIFHCRIEDILVLEDRQPPNRADFFCSNFLLEKV